jgi:hypothetical protein
LLLTLPEREATRDLCKRPRSRQGITEAFTLVHPTTWERFRTVPDLCRNQGLRGNLPVNLDSSVMCRRPVFARTPSHRGEGSGSRSNCHTVFREPVSRFRAGPLTWDRPERVRAACLPSWFLRTRLRWSRVGLGVETSLGIRSNQGVQVSGPVAVEALNLAQLSGT